jgi:hypothetical protein
MGDGTIDDLAGREYQSREFCKDVKCPMQRELDNEARDETAQAAIKSVCRNGCVYFSDDLMRWLGEHGYTTSQEVKLDLSGETASQLHDRMKNAGIKIFKKE